jgi:hypothetical protein
MTDPVKALREALEPFAEYERVASMNDRFQQRDDIIIASTEGDFRASLCRGDTRRAREALAAFDAQEKGGDADAVPHRAEDTSLRLNPGAIGASVVPCVWDGDLNGYVPSYSFRGAELLGRNPPSPPPEDEIEAVINAWVLAQIEGVNLTVERRAKVAISRLDAIRGEKR